LAGLVLFAPDLDARFKAVIAHTHHAQACVFERIFRGLDAC
jgi:hypothetical protein